jgi:hypothetical protein
MAVVVSGLALAVPVGAAHADPVPDPLASVTAPLTDAAPPLGDGLDEVAGTAAKLLDPAKAPKLPVPPAPPAAPGAPPGGVLPGGGQQPSDHQPSASADAQAPAGDDVAAVDAQVSDLLGLCVRVPQGAVPLQADVVVLDRNVIKVLTDAGLPLQDLVVPCPSTVGAPQAPAGSGDSPVTTAGDRDTMPVTTVLPSRLAFTGSEPVPIAVLGVLLLASGALLTRASFSVAAARG